MTQEQSTFPDDLFAGGGEMSQLMRELDWSTTAAGPVETWPQSLQTAVSICLGSRHPIEIWWGADYLRFYNDAYRPILGATKHPQFLGRPGRECWAEIWDVIGPMLDSVRETGVSTWSEDFLLIVTRNGYLEETYFTFSYSPIRDESGSVGGIFSACSETTERVLGERRLRTLRELAARTAQAKTSDDACHLATETLSNNKADVPFALLYLVEDEGQQARLAGTAGLKAGTTASPQQIDLTTLELDTETWPLAQVSRTGEAVIIDQLVSRLGSLPGGVWPESPHRAIIVPLTQSGQKPPLAGFLIIGISPRREFDDEYRGFVDLVASHVTTAIANTYAYEQECKRAAALAELDQAKTTFFSNVSHEFRTPLTLMLGPLEDLLTETPNLPPHKHKQLEMVHRNGLRLLKLVNTLLDFSRIEAGRIQAIYEPTDLAKFTAELASVFRSSIEQAGMNLEVDCPPLPKPVYVDREMWEKIVLNLLSNAFKFTFEGEISVHLRWVDDHVDLEVRDTGIGIPAEELPHLFERFHRVKGVQGRTYEGSGIGLSLVQGLVGLHGGTIQVTSTLGEGSCFTVSIPTGSSHLRSISLAGSEGSEGGKGTRGLGDRGIGGQGDKGIGGLGDRGIGGLGECSPHLIPSSPPHPVTSSPRILLADDNADMRDYVEGLLSQRYQVETVSDGMRALAAIRQQQPDLVLTDVMMPGLDGFELLRELRADSQTREIPIILLSARAGEEASVEGLEAGADDYLIKPFSARELLARVESHLKMARLRQEAAHREQDLRLQAEAAHQEIVKILESITDGFITLDAQWCYTYLNPEAERLVRRKQEDIIGKSMWAEFPDAVGSRFYQEFHRAIAEQIPVHFEAFYEPFDSWFEVRAYPLAEGLVIYFQDISDRKRTQEALHRREEDLRLITDTVPALISYVDSEQRYRFNNRGYEEWFGIPATAFYGKHLRDVLGEAAYETIRPYVERVLAGEQVFYEDQIDFKDGESRHIQATYVPRWDNQGKVEGFVALISDISDRKQAEAALHKSEILLNALLASSPMGLAFLDRDLRYIHANEALAAINGLPLSDHLGRTLWEVLPEWAPQLAPIFQHVMQTQKPVLNQEVSGETHPSGLKRHCLVSYYPVCLSDDQVLGVGVTSLDVTELKQAEDALRDALQKLTFHFENTPLGVIERDRHFRITRWSHSAQKIFGWQASEVIGQDLEMVYEEDLEAVETIRVRLLSGAEKHNISYNRSYKKDGSIVYCEWYNSALLDETGNLVSILSLVLDVTERKQAEAERDRLLKLEQAARAEAEAANRIKDEFLAILSHELRSPLNPILGWVQLLRSRKFDQKATDHALETIERNAKLQTQLIDDLLDVSRILRGKLVLNVGSVNLVTTIKAALETVRLAAQAKEIQIHTMLNSQIGQIQGDSNRLQQVLWNLLSNAVKFTPTGGRVDIHLDQVDSSAEIQVKDTGSGVSPEFLPHVFEYFRQENSTTTRRFGGLGLGLAIVRYLVELHGGSVKAESPGEGLGATFTVRLPLMVAALEATQEEVPSDDIVDLNGVKVLVVDDEADIRDLVAFILEQLGADITVVKSASEALVALNSSVPDILLCDIGMPEVDGYMLMRQVRALSPAQGGQVPAIALTAYAGEYHKEQALSAGFQLHLPKPVEPEELVKAIARLVGRR